MHDDLMKSYVDTMNAVGESEASRTMLTQAVQRERRGCDGARWTAVPKSARPVRRHRALRIAAAAACAGVLAVGGGMAIPRLVGRGAPVTAVSGLSGFVLTAYAEGAPVDAVSGTVVTADKLFKSGSRSWSGTDDGGIFTQYSIDPNCLGNDVASVEYRSTNENVTLEGQRDRGKVLPGETAGTPMLQSITVGGANATLPDLHELKLCVTAPADDEFNAIASSPASSDEDWTKMSLLAEQAAAQELASGTLEITATFADGSTETHAYRILPVDDFEAVWMRNEQTRKQAQESDTEFDQENLYMLEQVS